MSEQDELGSQPESSDADKNSGVIFGDSDPEEVESFWEEEAEKISEASEWSWFKPEPGTTEVLFLDEGEDQTRSYEDETREVRVFTVEVDGEDLKWSVTKGRSESSLYGQLVKVARSEGGLTGVSVSLIRSGTGTDTQYTVQEAADL